MPNISGVQLIPNHQYASLGESKHTYPYSTAHIVVALRLIPTVLALTAHDDSTITNTTQKIAVTNVLPANDQRRPRRDSIIYAPNCSGHLVMKAMNSKKKKKLTIAPGQPPIVNITTSHKLSSSDFSVSPDDPPTSFKEFGEKDVEHGIG